MRALVYTMDTKVDEKRKKEKQSASLDSCGDMSPYTNPRWINRGVKLEQTYEIPDHKTLRILGTLVTEEGKADKGEGYRPYTLINADLCKAWGITNKDGDNFGPAITFHYLDDNLSDSGEDINKDVTWVNRDRTLTEMKGFQANVTWEVINLDNGWFETTFLSDNKTVRVFSDVAESRIVGNQRVDLLREVRLDEDKKGQLYYEPRHLEFIPVLRQAFEVLEIHIDDLNGGTLQFGSGVTSVTLHFRRAIN